MNLKFKERSYFIITSILLLISIFLLTMLITLHNKNFKNKEQITIKEIMVTPTPTLDIDTMPTIRPKITLPPKTYPPVSMPTPMPNHRYSKIKDNITKGEIDILAQIVYLEAGIDSDKGQQAVIEVIFNRVNHYYFPDTIQGVIFQYGQFAVMSKYKKGLGQIRNKELTNIQIVLDGESNILPDDCVYFATRKLTDRFVVKIDNHYFCKY